MEKLGWICLHRAFGFLFSFWYFTRNYFRFGARCESALPATCFAIRLVALLLSCALAFVATLALVFLLFGIKFVLLSWPKSNSTRAFCSFDAFSIELRYVVVKYLV